MRKILATPFILLIRLYQKTLSPDHGFIRHVYPHGYCPHEPTCSEYAIQELETKPLLVALWSTIKRLASCHPWTKVSDEKLNSMLRKNS